MALPHRVDLRCTCSSQSENWFEHEHTSGHWCHLFELVASEDPGDRLDREAHGFTYDDDWREPAVYCRNGCGLRYEDVVAGKIRECIMASAK